MKINKLAMGLCLTTLVALGGGSLAYAQAASPQSPMSIGDPIPTQNTQYKGIKSPHSSRVAAAKQLKLGHQQQRQQQSLDWAKAHQGQAGGAQ